MAEYPDFFINLYMYGNKTYIQLENESNVSLRENIEDIMHMKLGVKEDGFQYSRAYQNGVWDGVTDFYDKNEQSFTTGLLRQALDGIHILMNHDQRIRYQIHDERNPKLLEPDDMDEEIELHNEHGENIILRDYQFRAVEKTMEHRSGIIDIATNGGKTEIACGAIQQLAHHLPAGKRIAFFVPSTEIFTKSKRDFAERLQVSEDFIGILGDGKDTVENKNIVICMIPTLVSRLKKPDKGVQYTNTQRVTKYIAEEVSPRFSQTANPKTLLKGFLKNNEFKSKSKQEVEQILTEMAYSREHSDAKVKLALKSYEQQLEKIKEKKIGEKYKKYQRMVEFAESIEVMIVDEAHHTGSDTHYDLFSKIPAPYRIGLTGTAKPEKAIAQQRMTGIYNQIITSVRNDELIDRGVSAKPTIKMFPIKEPRSIEMPDGTSVDATTVKDWMASYKGLITENDFRNTVISKIIHRHYKDPEDSVLVIVNHTTHGEAITEKLDELDIPYEFIHGEYSSEVRDAALQRVKNMETRVLIATSILDEGVSVNAVNVLVYASGLKSSRQVLQRIGRVLREKKGENTATVYDFYDKTNDVMLKHSKNRVQIYKDEKFTIQNLGKKK